MNFFNKIMKIYKILTAGTKAHYIGDCTNSFDSSGECIFSIFRDVSDFAAKEEEIREQIEEGRDLLLSFEDFSYLVNVEVLQDKDINNFEFYFYPETEFSPAIYVAYDIKDDIHYFFK